MARRVTYLVIQITRNLPLVPLFMQEAESFILGSYDELSIGTSKLKLLSPVRYGDLEAYVVDMLAEAKLNRKGVRGVASRRPIKRVPKADVASDSWMEN